MGVKKLARRITSAGGKFWLEILILREHNRVCGKGFVPHGDEFIAGLADVFAVDDRAAEDAWNIQTIAQGRVRPVGNRQIAIQIDAGRECSHTATGLT